jgi:hypothetical protein
MKNRYSDYAKIFGDVVALESSLAASRRALEDMKRIIREEDTDGIVGIEFSAHAIKQIQERLEALANESSVIYRDVLNTEHPEESILWPSNTKAFITGIMAKASDNGSVSPEPSRSNSTSYEYHYKIEIQKWSTDDKKLMFIGIVENNTIKTGYFNWV